MLQIMLMTMPPGAQAQIQDGEGGSAVGTCREVPRREGETRLPLSMLDGERTTGVCRVLCPVTGTTGCVLCVKRINVAYLRIRKNSIRSAWKAGFYDARGNARHAGWPSTQAPVPPSTAEGRSGPGAAIARSIRFYILPYRKAIDAILLELEGPSSSDLLAAAKTLLAEPPASRSDVAAMVSRTRRKVGFRGWLTITPAERYQTTLPRRDR